jgi:hypothetical protein
MIKYCGKIPRGQEALDATARLRARIFESASHELHFFDEEAPMLIGRESVQWGDDFQDEARRLYRECSAQKSAIAAHPRAHEARQQPPHRERGSARSGPARKFIGMTQSDLAFAIASG